MGVLRLLNGERIKTLTGHYGYVDSVVFSSYGEYLASGSWDYTICLWIVSSGKLIKTFTVHSDYIRNVSFSSNEEYLASGYDDKIIRMWKFFLIKKKYKSIFSIFI